MYKNVIGLIMAGGQRKRKETKIPKSLMKLNNKPIIWYSFKLLDEIGITEQIVSIPKNKDELYIQAINKIRPNIKCVADCVPQKGNAAGLASALPILNIEHDIIIVIHPDSSCLIKPDIIKAAINEYIKNDLLVSFGIKESGLIKAQQAKNNPEFEPETTGISILNKKWLKEKLNLLPIDTKSQEWRIEYLFEIINKESPHKLSLFIIPNQDYININTQSDLKIAELMLKKQ